jgi:hypothetical protein
MINRLRHYGATLFIAAIAIFPLNSTHAQDLDPRRYTNIPVGQNFLALAVLYSEGDVTFAPSVPLTDARIRVDGPALAYLRSFAIAGKSASFDVLLPYGCVAGSAVLDGERASRDVCGLGDSALRVSYNFIGAPAAELPEFVRQKKATVVGASLQVGMPTGQYDDDKLLNVGANRWYIKPEIGLSIPWKKWSFEFAAGVRIFSDNDSFVDGATLSQDPIYNIQSHVIYDLRPVPTTVGVPGCQLFLWRGHIQEWCSSEQQAKQFTTWTDVVGFTEFETPVEVSLSFRRYRPSRQ